MTLYLFSQSFHWGDVDTATFNVVQQHPQNSKLSTDGLSTARGSAHKHVIVTVVHSVEHWRDRKNATKSRKQCKTDKYPQSQSPQEPKKAIFLLNDNVCSIFFCTLCLNGVEERELVLVESLKSRVSEGSDRQWLQVQQLSGWGVLLG